MRYLFFVIFFFLVFKSSKEYLHQQLIIDRPSFLSVAPLNSMEDGFRIVPAFGNNVDCSKFNALGVSAGMPSDRCVCSNDAATFSFFKGKWQCVDNEDFRELEDCGLRFPMESEETPLKLLADRDEMVINLPPRNCSINASSCMYLDCQTWRPIDKMIVIDKFRLTHRKMDNHMLKVLSGNLSSFLNGRVIKLSITCLTSAEKPCLIFKLKGSIMCPFEQDNAQTTIMASPPSTLQQIYSSTPFKEFLSKSMVHSYKQTERATVSSSEIVVQTTPSFRSFQTLHISTTPIIQGSPTISRENISFAASSTSLSQVKTLTKNVSIPLRTSDTLTTPISQGSSTIFTEKISFYASSTPFLQLKTPTGNDSVLFRTFHVSTTGIIQGGSTILRDKISICTTLFPQTKTSTGYVAVSSSHKSATVSRFVILPCKGHRTELIPHQSRTSHTNQYSTTDIAVMFNGVKSIGVNLTSGRNRSTLSEKICTTSPPENNVMNMLLRTVLPGTVVGIFVISVSLLLLCIARRMGNLIRVGTDRNEGAQGEVQSVSEDATVNGSEEENLSVYELVERGNNAHLSELRQTVTNPNYQREGNLVLQDFSHAIRHPNDNEIIYAEPFAPLPAKSGNDTRLTSLTGSGGASSPETTSNIYQSLKGKSAESVLYASRYSVPEQLGQGPSKKCTDQAFLKAPSMSGDLPCITEVLSDTERYSETQQSEPVPFFNGLRQERLIGASVGHLSSTNVDDLPNVERKARYRLKDVFVEDLEIETRGTNDPFQDISISPSVLLSDTAETGNRDCENIQHGHVNAVKEHFNALAQLSQGTRPQKRNTESVENAKCFNDVASSENKFSPQEKLQAFFKMTL